MVDGGRPAAWEDLETSEETREDGTKPFNVYHYHWSEIQVVKIPLCETFQKARRMKFPEPVKGATGP